MGLPRKVFNQSLGIESNQMKLYQSSSGNAALKRALILCPHLEEKGGVAHYYRLVRKHFRSDKLVVDFYHTGKEHISQRPKNRLQKSLHDFLALLRKFKHYDLIVLNPSLDFRALIRDGTLNCIAKHVFHTKTLIFFHGWMLEVERFINKHARSLFRFFFKSDKVVVLSKQFITPLVHWGIDPEKIHVETTTYERNEFSASKDLFKIIFLSRFVRGKGCLEAIRSVEMLIGEYPHVTLFMVGDGSYSTELQDYVAKHHLSTHVKFTGWLDGESKYHILSQCGIMLYPTAYGEGMPISLLEGMGSGLAIVTRPVAGISDVFVNGKNGFLVESQDPSDFAEKLRYLFEDKDLWQGICYTNKIIAEQQFEVGVVVKRLEKLYLELIQDK